MKKRLAIVVTHPIQYHIVIWRELSKHPQLEVEVLYCSRKGIETYYDKDFNLDIKWDVDLLSGYNYLFFNNSKFARPRGFFQYYNPKLIYHLYKEKYDLVYFHGINHLTHILSLFVAKVNGSTVIVRNIAHLIDVNKNSLNFKIRKLIFSFLYKIVDYVFFIGKHNQDFFRELGVAEKKLFHVPHIVDNDFFKIEKSFIDIESVYEEYEVKSDNLVFLFCAKFYEKKQPFLLLEAFHKSDITNVSLLMVGDGPMKESLIRLRNSLSWDNGKEVIFTGFLNQSKLPAVYYMSEVIILPSMSETWGLVINEAFNFDCAAIVSDKVGCAPEVIENKAGVVFPYRSVNLLVESIEELSNQPRKLEYYQKNAKHLNKQWHVSKFSNCFDVILSKES